MGKVESRTFDDYLRAFTHLRRATGAVWGDGTRRRAPHKPILLLAVLDLLARGAVPKNFIDLTPELSELFSLYWSRALPPGQKSSIAFPFFHLQSEGFWHLVAVPGHENKLSAVRSISTVSQLTEIALGARLDDALYLILQQKEKRDVLRASLIRTYFSPDVQSALLEQAEINAVAFDYSISLIDKAHSLVKEGQEEEGPYKPSARDQGFRRAIVTTYNHRCALCGIRMITPDGHTVVDAAHIIPWSVSHDDDVRNGMALCRLCHWAFDKGMMGIADNYTVITSPQMQGHANVPGFLLTLSGRGIIGPAEEMLWPSRESLAWHRKEFRLKAA